MRGIWTLAYNLLIVPGLFLLANLAAPFIPKLKEGLMARRISKKQWKEALKKIPRDVPRILFHATSVGEWEQAVPLIERFKSDHPHLYVVVSFYSPSGYNYVKKHPDVDLKVYLPFDSYPGAYEFLSTLRPSLWVISKFDIWPNHMFVAKRLKIPVVLIAATLSSNSGRTRGLAGSLSKAVYPIFDMIFPISEEDRDRFFRLYPNEERLIITGDTRFDRVHERGLRAQKQGPVRIFADKPDLTFIAGSIWPADEKHLLPALIELLQEYPQLHAVLVPHELHEQHIRDIEIFLEDAGLTSERYTEMETSEGSRQRIVIINTIGMLARLYMNTDFAYIGGSFSTGVHNVMEPATFGQPVVFGPVHENSYEAMELMKIGSAFSVSSSAQMKEVFTRMVVDESFRRDAGRKAVKLIEENLGASEKIYSLLKEKYGTFPKIHPN